MKQIPTNATCVYQGGVFRLWEREQQLFDGSTKTFELVERQDTAFILPVQNNKLLLTYQRQPQKPDRYRDFVGGRIHRDTDPVEGAKRELREETGMKASHYTLWKTYDLGGSSMKYRWYFFIATGIERVSGPSLDPGGEEIETKRIDRQTLGEMLTNDTLKAVWLSNEFLRHKLHGTEDQFLDEIFAA